MSDEKEEEITSLPKDHERKHRWVEESGLYADIKANLRKILFGLGSFILLILAIALEWTWLLWGALVGGGVAVYAYYFWMGRISVPRTFILEVDNSNRIVDVAGIPDKMMPEFEIDGLKHYFYDEWGTPILIADEFNFSERYIKCSYSHKVSNLKLATKQEALDDAREDAIDLHKENARLEENMDLEVERRIKRSRDAIKEKVQEDLQGENDGARIITEEEARKRVGDQE